MYATKTSTVTSTRWVIRVLCAAAVLAAVGGSGCRYWKRDPDAVAVIQKTHAATVTTGSPPQDDICGEYDVGGIPATVAVIQTDGKRTYMIVLLNSSEAAHFTTTPVVDDPVDNRRRVEQALVACYSSAVRR